MSRHIKQSSSSPQVMCINDDYYEVETILNRRPSPNGMLYLIKWVNYPDPKDYTWEPLQNLTDVKALVQQFEQKFQAKERAKATHNSVQKSVPPRRAKKDQDSDEQQQDQDHELKAEIPKVQKRGRKKGGINKPKLVKDAKRQKVKQLNSEQQQQPQSDQQKLNRERERQMVVRTFQPNLESFVARKKNESKKQNSSKTKKEIFYEEDKFKLGRICAHFEEDKELHFNVNLLNKDNQICAMVTMAWHDLIQKYQQKLHGYLEDYTLAYTRNDLNKQRKQVKEFQGYWKSLP